MHCSEIHCGEIAKKLNRLQRNSICYWITLHAFQTCRPAKSTAKFQNTHFWQCNVQQAAELITQRQRIKFEVIFVINKR